MQCSRYEDGARWCDFCSKRVFGKSPTSEEIIKPETAEHGIDCPFNILRAEIKSRESENKYCVDRARRILGVDRDDPRSFALLMDEIQNKVAIGGKALDVLLIQSSTEKKLKYRVLSSRHDIAEHVAGTFEADDEKEALIVFRERYENNPNYAWDYLRLVRIDQEEVTTQIKASKK
jgi:hypothetical protein